MNESLTWLSETPLPWQKHQWQRLVKQRQASQLAHGFLFSGVNGLGKFLFAYRFAQYLLCASPADDKPCGQCRNCQMGKENFHPDVLVVQTLPEKKIIGVGQVRELADFVQHTSHLGGARIIIVRDAHRMNIAAANALLKTLEEPARNTYLFLLSDLPGYLSATIRSRCQRLQFAVPSLELGSAWLEQKLPAEIDATALLVASNGRPLEALALAEGEGLENQQEFRKLLDDLVTGKISPQSLASYGQKLGEFDAIQYFAQSSTILIKGLLAGQSGSVTGQDLQATYRALSARQPRKSDLLALMKLYQDSLEARRQLLSGANPNAQLVLESLCWRWSRLLQ